MAAITECETPQPVLNAPNGPHARVVLTIAFPGFFPRVQS